MGGEGCDLVDEPCQLVQGFLLFTLPGGGEGQTFWGISWTIHHSFVQSGSHHWALVVRAAKGPSPHCRLQTWGTGGEGRLTFGEEAPLSKPRKGY